jgi:K+-transporting ATPase KdpF subunit
LAAAPQLGRIKLAARNSSAVFALTEFPRSFRFLPPKPAFLPPDARLRRRRRGPVSIFGLPSLVYALFTRAPQLFIKTFISISLIFMPALSVTGEHNNGSGLPRRHRRILGTLRGIRARLRKARASFVGRPRMSAWMIWLASAATLLLLVYLVYALLRAEDLE